jgi:hypothetical protein
LPLLRAATDRSTASPHHPAGHTLALGREAPAGGWRWPTHSWTRTLWKRAVSRRIPSFCCSQTLPHTRATLISSMRRSALGTLCLCAAAALLALAFAAPAAAMRPSHPDEVTDLPGLSFKPTFRHYSGYIPLPNSPKMFQSDKMTPTMEQRQHSAMRYGGQQSSPFHLRLSFFFPCCAVSL